MEKNPFPQWTASLIFDFVNRYESVVYINVQCLVNLEERSICIAITVHFNGSRCDQIALKVEYHGS